MRNMNPDQLLQTVITDPTSRSQKLLEWLARRGIWVIAALLLIAAVSTIYYLRTALSASRQEVLLDNAETLASSVRQFRNFYSQTVVPRARDAGMQISMDYKKLPHALPLPATFTLDFGDYLTKVDGNSRIGLFSKYPFENRKDRQLDAFQREALDHLHANPDKPFFRSETIDNRQVLRYATADRMEPSCVGCHNTIAGSPKTDWKIGDVRGAIEVRQFILPTSGEQFAHQPLREAMTSLGLISAVLGLLVLGAVAGLRSYLNRNLLLARSEQEANSRLLTEVEKRAESEKLAKLNETRLKQIFNSVLEGVVVIDSSSKIIEINDAALSMFGYARAALIGANVNTLMPEKIGQMHNNFIRNYESSGSHWMLAEPRRVIARRRSGDEFPIRIAVSETRTSGNSLYTAVIQDITVTEQTEQALRKAKDAAEAASQLKSEFLANMSHELRTPLNAILGHAQLMSATLERVSGQDQPGDKPAVTGADGQQTPALTGTSGDRQAAAQADHIIGEHADEIMRSGWHLLSLIEEVLDLSKIESGVNDSELHAVALLDMIDECRQQLLLQAEKAGVRLLETRADPGNEQVQADPRRLRQVLINLLSNAIKYNRAGGTVQVLVHSAGPRRIGIEIIDTGRGMTEAQLSQLFQPFVRFVRPGEVIEGSGIGLALSRRLVEQMNGTLTVRSVPDKGSDFVIELDTATQAAAPRPPDAAGESVSQIRNPFASADTSQPKAASESSPVAAQAIADGKANANPPSLNVATSGAAVPGSSENRLRPLNVLYIEDTPANYEIVRMYLEMQGGFTISNAIDGENGIRQARESRPDIILLDMSLPGLQGMQVRQILAETRETADIPVIALSAAATSDDIDRAMQAGFIDYLTKPVRLTKLAQVLNRFREKNS